MAQVKKYQVAGIDVWVEMVEDRVKRIGFKEVRGAFPASTEWKKVDEFFEKFNSRESIVGLPFEVYEPPSEEKLRFYFLLQKIPPGKTLSYGEIAEKFWGSKKYARLAGRWLGENRWPLLFPCHRVIRKNGSLGGFSGGLEIKEKLLNWERGI